MPKPLILGIHVGHDSGAAIIEGGKIRAAVNEERFVGIKHYCQFPLKSIEYCLFEVNANVRDIKAIAFSIHLEAEKFLPFLTGYNNNTKKLLNGEDRGLKQRFISDIVELFQKFSNFVLSEKFRKKIKYKSNTPTYFKPFEIFGDIPIYIINHHLAHAASAYYTRGNNQECLIITSDGIGSGGISTGIWHGRNGKIKPLYKVGREGSLGWFYGIITEGLGWWVGNGEGKTMGLASYGNPNSLRTKLESMTPCYEKGVLKKSFPYSYPITIPVLDAIHWHFQESQYIKKLCNYYKREDIAAAAQALLEEKMLKIIEFWMNKLEIQNVNCAGGVFLNVKMNQFLLNNLKLNDFYVFPNAGDGGLALGAALQVYSQLYKNPKFEPISNVFLGPGYSNEDIERILNLRKLKYKKVNDISKECGERLIEGKIIGWFQSRMEYGPRALGNRSILMDPRNKNNKDIINNYVKFREPWRPFCPSILEEEISNYLINPRKAPYMIISFDMINKKIQEVPAVVHVDGTTRPQTVSEDDNVLFYHLIHNFYDQTSIPMILNTSFNIKGQPIVCSPIDAIECFYNTGLDVLAINDFLIEK